MTDSVEQVTCQDCVHNRASWLSRKLNANTWAWECQLDYNEPTYDFVTGKTKKAYYGSCHGARYDSKVCGKDGKSWQPRSKKNMFIYLKRI